MGTTAEKETYLNTTKSLLKSKINNLGGEITDNTTFRNYANQLQNVYDNYPKTSFQTGTEVTLENCNKGKIDFDEDNGKKVVGIGQTEQETTTGKNLFNVVDLRDYNATSNNATITKKINEISFVSGSSNSSGFYTSKSYWSNYIQNYVEGTTYKVSADIVASQNTTVKFGNDSTSAVSVTANTKTRFSFDLTAGAIVCYTTNQTSGITIKVTNIMFSTSSDTTYEKYTGGYSSPSPNWEQEVKYVRGKNKINNEMIVMGTIDANGRTDYSTTRARTIDIPLISGETYTISSSNSNLNVVTYYYNSSGTFVSYDSGWKTIPFTFTMPNNATKLKILFKNGSTNTISLDEITNIQLEKGSQATPYLSYNTIEEVVGGKNLFDIGRSLDDWFQTSTNGTKIGDTSVNVATATISNNKLTIDTYNTSGWNWISKWVTLKKNTDYIISGTNDTGIKIVGFSSNELQSTGTELASKSASETTKTFNSGDYGYYCLSMYPGSTGKYIENIQIEANSTETPYEPYITPKSYQLSLGDIELNAIGNYKDELIYDVDEDKVYKNEKIGKVVLNGTQDTQYISVTQGSLFRMALVQSVANIPLYCTHYKGLAGGQGRTDNTFYYNPTAHGSENRFDFIDNRFTNADDFNDYLEDHNATLYYILRTPTLTEITDTTLISQLNAWYNAQSINGTTIITSNGDLPMIIKVRGLKGE